MELIREYVRSVISELKVDRKFLSRLRGGVGPSLASRGRQVASQWIRNLEAVGGELNPVERKQVIDFASYRYSKVFRRYENNYDTTDYEIQRMLDLKFAALKVR